MQINENPVLDMKLKADTDDLLYTRAFTGFLQVINSCNKFKMTSGVQKLHTLSTFQGRLFYAAECIPVSGSLSLGGFSCAWVFCVCLDAILADGWVGAEGHRTCVFFSVRNIRCAKLSLSNSLVSDSMSLLVHSGSFLVLLSLCLLLSSA